MPDFAWRRRATRHFGDQWVPFAELSLQATSGLWQTFSVQIDTGAAISVLRLSAAELLGIKLDSASQVDLVSVEGGVGRYFVHELQARMDDGQFPLRIAFSSSENSPNLLGRLDVIDRFQLDLDPSLHQSRLSPPWLDSVGEKIWNHLVATEAAILAKWQENPLAPDVDEAARRFLNRADQLVVAAAGLAKLHRGYELPLVIRALFDLSVQFEYLMEEPGARARLYLDFGHITKFHFSQKWTALPGTIGDALRSSTIRPAGEKHLRNNYERVHPLFAKKNGSDRTHWYPGNLKTLAEKTGRAAEYDAVFHLYSAWAHGDPFAASLSAVAHAGLMQAFFYWARILVKIANAKWIILSNEQYSVLNELARGIS